jgi:hypothetical protein
MAEPSMVTCAACGRVPTREEPIRRHVGMLIMQRFIRLQQPLCRDHGIQFTRSYLGQTLVQGWWGVISFFVNFFVIGSDLLVLRRYQALDAPRDAAGAATATASPASPALPGQVAGWFADPTGRFEHRWYDGQAWTGAVARAGQQLDDPLAR